MGAREAAVIRPGAELTAEALNRYMLERLSGFKVPRSIVFVDAIPKSDAGKVQRFKLAETLGLEVGVAPAHFDQVKGEAATRDNRRSNPSECVSDAPR